MLRTISMTAATLALVACSAPMTNSTGGAAPNEGYIGELPERVVALAAPYQNLSEVRINPEDNCYWYRHYGPVETTMLPLRTTDGRQICTG